MPLVIAGATSGSTTIQATDATTQTVTLPSATGTAVLDTATQTLTNKTLTSPTITGASMSSMASSVLTSGTAQNTTSGTSITFSSIPSWVKRITVTLNNVFNNGTDSKVIRIGSGSVTSTGYSSLSGILPQALVTTDTTGFVLYANGSADPCTGHMILTNVSGNIWISSHSMKASASQSISGGGSVTLSGTLDRVVLSTTGGTGTFTAGSVNILYE